MLHWKQGEGQEMSNPTEPANEQSISDLVRQLTEQSNELARKEIELAKAELEAKARTVGTGIGAFGGAGVVSFLALGALTATLILGLAETLDPWLAALVVTVVYSAIAGVMALIGRRKVEEATPPTPDRAFENTRRDVEEIKENTRKGLAR